MHHPTDRITHTTAFATPVVEHWLEWIIAQCVHVCMYVCMCVRVCACMYMCVCMCMCVLLSICNLKKILYKSKILIYITCEMLLVATGDMMAVPCTPPCLSRSVQTDVVSSLSPGLQRAPVYGQHATPAPGRHGNKLTSVARRNKTTPGAEAMVRHNRASLPKQWTSHILYLK